MINLLLVSFQIPYLFAIHFPLHHHPLTFLFTYIQISSSSSLCAYFCSLTSSSSFGLSICASFRSFLCSFSSFNSFLFSAFLYISMNGNQETFSDIVSNMFATFQCICICHRPCLYMYGVRDICDTVS
eukprot:362401_1